MLVKPGPKIQDLPSKHGRCPAVIDKMMRLSEDLCGADVRPVIVDADLCDRPGRQDGYTQQSGAEEAVA